MSALKWRIDCPDRFGGNDWLFQFVLEISVNFGIRISFFVIQVCGHAMNLVHFSVSRMITAAAI